MQKERPERFPDTFHTLICEFVGEQSFDLNPTTVFARLSYKETPDGPEIVFLERKTTFTDVSIPHATAASISFLKRFFIGRTPWLTTHPQHIEFRLHDLYTFLILTEQINRWDRVLSNKTRRKLRKLLSILGEPSHTITYVDEGNQTNMLNGPRQFAGTRPSATNWETGEAYKQLFIASMKNRRNL